jgi:hypothetical protein
VDLYPGDAPAVQWSFSVVTVPFEGGIDFGGPYVHGRRGDRFLYLSWGAGGPAGTRMFRRAKLHFADAGPAVITAAAEAGAITCRVRMTDAYGNPRCARARPPDAIWTARPAQPSGVA